MTRAPFRLSWSHSGGRDGINTWYLALYALRTPTRRYWHSEYLYQGRLRCKTLERGEKP
jgi:hypothetical protein